MNEVLFVTGAVVLSFIAPIPAIMSLVGFVDYLSLTRKKAWLKRNGFSKVCVGTPRYAHDPQYAWVHESRCSSVSDQLMQYYHFKDLVMVCSERQ